MLDAELGGQGAAGAIGGEDVGVGQALAADAEGDVARARAVLLTQAAVAVERDAELRRDLGVVGSLAELGMPESGIDDAVAPILAAAPVSNPVPATEENITALLRKAWAGEDPT